MSKRVEQMKELFRRAISKFILEEIEMPKNIIVTVMNAVISKDLKNAKFFVSIYPDNLRGSGLEVLIKNIPLFKRYLADNFSLRTIPTIRYYIDDSQVRAGEIDEILKKIEDEEALEGEKKTKNKSDGKNLSTTFLRYKKSTENITGNA